jgi:hypothetical protein
VVIAGDYLFSTSLFFYKSIERIIMKKVKVWGHGQTEHISFKCTPTEKRLLETMAESAGVYKSKMIQILIWEGAEKRLIQLEPEEKQT